MSIERPNEYLNYLINPSFQGVIRLFVLSLENNTHRKRHTGYFLAKVEIKDYNLLINGQNFFDKLVKNDQIIYWSFEKLQ